MSVDSHVGELLPAYALNCLDEEETLLVTRHLPDCALCQAELASYQVVADQIALAVPESTPPAALKHRLLQHVQPEQRKTPASSRLFWRPVKQRLTLVWQFASLILILALLAGNVLLWQRVNQLEVAARSGDMQAIPLTGTEIVPGASGFIIISSSGRNGALVVDGLPPLGPEQQYQLWLIRDGERTSGAIFSVDDSGYGGVRIWPPESLYSYSAVGVTVEPAEGSPGPTGDRVLTGTLRQ